MSDIIVSRDIVKEIIKHLPVIDIYNFRTVSKTVFGVIELNQIIINKINHRLKSILGDKFDVFKSRLEQVGGAISGSTIIQCCLDEDWETDVDVYLLNKNLKPVEIKCRSISDFDDFLYCTLDHISVNYNPPIEYENGHEKIKSIRTYKLINSKTMIQTVVVDSPDDSVDKFIYRHADFNICRNVFGTLNGQDYIKIQDLDGIINRRTQFRLGNFISNTFARYNKYCNRRFTFTNHLRDFFDQIREISEVYKIFHVEKCDPDSYQVIKGDIDVLKSMEMYKSSNDWNLPGELVSVFIFNNDTFKINSEVARLSECGKSIICPVKFCYGDEKEHFHIENQRNETELIFVL